MERLIPVRNRVICRRDPRRVAGIRYDDPSESLVAIRESDGLAPNVSVVVDRRERVDDAGARSDPVLEAVEIEVLVRRVVSLIVVGVRDDENWDVREPRDLPEVRRREAPAQHG